MYKIKSSTLKVPPLKNPRPKLQNYREIKPTSGFNKQVDFRFETDEEIQTENQCRHPSKRNDNNQKKNNQSVYGSLRNDQIQQQPAKRTRKMCIYHYDMYSTDCGTDRDLNQRPITNQKQEPEAISKKVQPLSQSKNRRFSRIFDNKNLKSNPQNLPLALMPFTQINSKPKVQNYQQCHIVFESIQITECCF